MVSYLLFILTLRMYDYLWDKSEKNIFEQFGCEAEFSPVMTLLHNVQNIS